MSFTRNIILCCVLLVLFTTYSFCQISGDQRLSDPKDVFIKQMVRAVNAKDLDGLKALMTRSAKACLSPENEKYFNELLSGELKEGIPADAAIDIKELSAAQIEGLKRLAAIEEKIGLHHDALPTHRLDYSYRSLVGRYLVKEGSVYKKDYACPSPEWVENYWKRKNDPLEDMKYYKKLNEIMQDQSKSIPLAKRQSFAKDEYGALFWSTDDTYPHAWRFKTKAKMRHVTIKLIGPGEEEVEVVNYDFLKGRMPLDFTLYLGEPKKVDDGGMLLKVPYGYSRQGEYPKAVSAWIDLKGNEVKNSFTNKIVSEKDILDRSKEIILATFQTRDEKQPYNYGVKLFVQTEGSYSLNYGYHVKDGKIEGYLTDGENKYYSDASLTAWVKTLPAETYLEVFGTCKMADHEPLKSEEGLKEFRDVCAQHKIQCTYHPGG